MASIPPVCGGYRNQYALMLKNGRYSPRVRGLSEQRFRIIWLERVFPPCAGVIGGALNRHPLAGSIPPVCGGYRWCCPRLPAGWKYSPRERGLSVPDSCFRQWIKVFPPHAGVNGTTRSEWTPVMSIPPARGGIDIKTAMVGLLLCAPTSRWDFLQSRKVTFFRITHILSNLAGCNQQRPYVDKFMP